MLPHDPLLLLNRLPNPQVPENLAARILSAVAARQTRRACLFERSFIFAKTLSAIGAVSALAFFVREIGFGNITPFFTSAAADFNSVPLKETALALLENAPLGSLFAMLTVTAIFLVLISVRQPAHKARAFKLHLSHV